ncbi:hypothetical protein BDV95DRAFT_600102 [Massariosphaeria phaeospora]|uniref:Uncharacterized protein n=1 Tax=Massariosphaeria phaeospora TaxID=100035 RepID=A0A7C8M3T6_9PLEO|nr:hypothetical protein BDV95DRAFT_600102 [Massariosphaeria phaeospora]
MSSSHASTTTATATAKASPHSKNLFQLSNNAVNVGTVTLLILAILALAYFLWCGSILARLWYYQGQFAPEHTKYDIRPQYLKDRYRNSQMNPPPSRNTAIARTEPGRFTGQTLVSPATVTDLVIRAHLAEERRISRLPAFVQDDCGDGSEFPDVPLADHLRAIEPHPDPPFRAGLVNYMTMGLRKLVIDNWLTVDNTYKQYHEARIELLHKCNAEVIQVLPEAEPACEELMREVVDFLVKKYPRFFKIVIRSGVRKIRNELVQEEYSLQRPFDCQPLEVCARLAMEDFSILKKSDFTQGHHLQASATLFPAGWRLRQRIGKSITDVHGPVPLWKDLPDVLNISYFARINPDSFMERSSFFIQIAPPATPLAALLFIQDGKDFFAGNLGTMRADNVIVRRERQTFRRLGTSGAIVFGVKTSVQRLVDVPVNERQGLADEIKSWPPEMATYKGRDLWQRTVVGFCEQRNLVHDDRTVASDAGSMTRVNEEE